MLDTCNVDLNRITNDHLETLHQSIDLANPYISEILDYLSILRSTTILQQEFIEHIRCTMYTIGDEEKAQQARVKKWGSQQSKDSKQETAYKKAY